MPYCSPLLPSPGLFDLFMPHGGGQALVLARFAPECCGVLLVAYALKCAWRQLPRRSQESERRNLYWHMGLSMGIVLLGTRLCQVKGVS